MPVSRQGVTALVAAATVLLFAAPALAPANSSDLPSSEALGKGDPRDCDDFDTQKQAQRWFKRHHPRRDPAGLDADNDRIACEENPCPCTSKARRAADQLAARRE